MSTQQDIYAAGSENRPPILNKDNYIPWSSRLLRYAKSKPNRKFLVNSIKNAESTHEQTDDELIDQEAKQMEADDQEIQTILPEDIYAAVDSYPITAMNMALVLMAKAFKLNYSTPTNNNQRISLNPRNRHIAQSGMNMGQDRQIQMIGGQGVQNVRNQNGLIVVPGTTPLIANQNANQNGNGNVVAAQAEGNANGNNGIQLQAKEFDLMAAIGDIDEIEDVNANCVLMANLQQESTSSIQISKAPVYDSDGTSENDSNAIHGASSVEQSRGTVYQNPAIAEEIRAHFESLYNNLATKVERVNMIHKIFKDEIVPIVNQVDARVQNFKNHFVKEAATFVRDFKSLAKKAKDSLDKIKVLEIKNERLLRAVVSQDIMSIVQNNSVVDTSDLQTELERTKDKLESCIIKKEKEYATLWDDWYKKCKECKYDKLSYDKAYNDMQHQIERLQAQLGDLKDKSSNTQCASNTLDHLVDNIAKTRRPQPRSNTKNDRVPSASKSSSLKNKEVKVEEHHRNLLLYKNKRHISSECNNIKLAIRNDKSEVVCGICKQCLITANHDVCVLTYVNDMNSRDTKQSANVSNIENQKKQKPKV
ncbi:hypothetical protein Tco_1245928 [Tanacetum coccineum]